MTTPRFETEMKRPTGWQVARQWGADRRAVSLTFGEQGEAQL